MGDEQEWKFLLGDIYGEEKIEVGIVSERWRISDDEIMYPTNVAGAKWEMLIRMHTAPDLTSSDWLKYPFKLKKVCSTWAAAKEFEDRYWADAESELNTEHDTESRKRKRTPNRKYLDPCALVSEESSEQSEDDDYDEPGTGTTVSQITGETETDCNEETVKSTGPLHSYGKKDRSKPPGANKERRTPAKNLQDPWEPLAITVASSSTEKDRSKPPGANKDRRTPAKNLQDPWEPLAITVASSSTEKDRSKPPGANKERRSPAKNLQDPRKPFAITAASSSTANKDRSKPPGANKAASSSAKRGHEKASGYTKDRETFSKGIDSSSIFPSRSSESPLTAQFTPPSINRKMAKRTTQKNALSPPRPFKDKITKDARTSSALAKPQHLQKAATPRTMEATSFEKEFKRPRLDQGDENKIISLLLKKVLDLTDKVDQLLLNQNKLLSFVETQHAQSMASTSNDIIGLPIMDTSKFLLLKELLKSDVNRQTLVSKLFTAGGNNLNDRVHRVWALLVSDECGIHLAWAGTNGKIKVKHSNVFDLVYDSVCANLLYKNSDRSIVEKSSQSWIYKSSQRLERKEQKEREAAAAVAAATGDPSSSASDIVAESGASGDDQSSGEDGDNQRSDADEDMDESD